MAVVNALLVCAQVQAASLLDGRYEVALYNSSTKKIEAQPRDLPPGQVKHGYIQGGRFAIVDMMVGFQGPIKKHGKNWKFIFEEGPSGKVKGKLTVGVVTASSDRKVLSFRIDDIPVMVWTWKEAKVPFKLPY